MKGSVDVHTRSPSHCHSSPSMSVPGKSVTWSVKGWLCDTPGRSAEPEQRRLSFAEVSYAVLDTVREAGELMDALDDAVAKERLDEMRKELRSAAAQYVTHGAAPSPESAPDSVGQRYNAEPTPANEDALKVADKILGVSHNKIRTEMVRRRDSFALTGDHRASSTIKRPPLPRASRSRR